MHIIRRFDARTPGIWCRWWMRPSAWCGWPSQRAKSVLIHTMQGFLIVLGSCIRHWTRCLLMVLALCAALGAWSHGALAGELRLTPDTDRYALWPVLTMLADPHDSMSAEDLIGRSADFTEMPEVEGTLGSRKGTVWLRTRLTYAGDVPERWILHLDYAPLHLMEVFVLRHGTISLRVALGSLQGRQRAVFKTRTHALPIDLRPGESVELLMRVKTSGAMVLPLSIGLSGPLLESALSEQGLQGAMAGLALGLLLYSLLQWLALHDRLFLYYAIFTLGSLSFSLHLFGLSTQHLWGSHHWAQLHASGLSGLIALFGTLMFASHALKPSGGADDLTLRAMRAAAVFCVVCAVPFVLDLIGLRAMSMLIAALSLLSATLGLPRAVSMTRMGDPVGVTMLIAWLVYIVGNGIMAGMLYGKISFNFWTMHSFQFGSTVTMLLFMRVLNLRALQHRLVGMNAERERDHMRSLAHTDPLTGLANRRGLYPALADALADLQQDQLLAVYMIDLDGFKAVNDQFGHEAGDALLVAVARRLQAQVRQIDLVARLGGDEFVVVVRDPGGLQNAQMRGLQLLDAFQAPVQVAGQQIRVGMTVGYAVAPLDATDMDGLLRHADQSLYDGKLRGKSCVRRMEAEPDTAAQPA